MIKITTLLAILCASISPVSMYAVESITTTEKAIGNILNRIEYNQDKLSEMTPKDNTPLGNVYKHIALTALSENNVFKHAFSYLASLLKELRKINADEEKTTREIERNIFEKLNLMKIEFPSKIEKTLSKMCEDSKVDALLENSLEAHPWIQAEYGFKLDAAEDAAKDAAEDAVRKSYGLIWGIIGQNLKNILRPAMYDLYYGPGLEKTSCLEAFTQDKKDQMIKDLEECAKELITVWEGMSTYRED